MKSRSLLVCLLLAVPALAPGASKEIQELQRDVALLQQQIKDLQRSQDEKLAAILEAARSAVDAANRANTSVAVITSNLEKNLRDQTDKVATPVVGLSTRLNEMGGELRTLGQAVGDLTALVNRLQVQLTDINNAIKVIQQPPVAPPAQPGQPGTASASDVPPMQAEPMYNAARQDYVSGKYDLAVQGFADYLKYYGNTGFAPNAQFYIAMIHFAQGNYEAAVKEFDLVLEKYTDNPKTADALLYKGRALVKMPGHKTDGANEFMEVIRNYPKSDQAVQACTERKALGLNCGAPPAAARARPCQAQEVMMLPLTTCESLAKLIDHPLVQPELTDEQVIEGLELAKRYNIACASVRPCDIDLAVRTLQGSSVKAGAVCGFPHGSANTATKLYEARDLLRRGAREIDMVVAISKLLSREFQHVQMELLQMSELCHKEGALLKVILENAYLTDELKIIACRCCERAEVDFVATSTGFAPSGYTLPDIALMRKYLPEEIGVKADGGIRTVDQVLEVYEASCTRIGTTSTAAILDEWKARLAPPPDASTSTGPAPH